MYSKRYETAWHNLIFCYRTVCMLSIRTHTTSILEKSGRLVLYGVCTVKVLLNHGARDLVLPPCTHVGAVTFTSSHAPHTRFQQYNIYIYIRALV